MKFKTLCPLLFSLGVMNACATSKEESKPIAEVAGDDIVPHDGNSAEVQPNEIDDSIDQELVSSVNGNVPDIGTEEDEINVALKKGIPVELNENVERWIDFFANKNHDAFQRFLNRGQPYKKMLVATLRDTGVPSEIYYLAMIESGFVLQAHSSASAVGFWQFIPATGRRYGLRVDRFVDERRDPFRSTVAASLYLADLHNVFNSWYLAMAAYNAGEMRIMNAIMRGKTRDFWDLVRAKVLPAETMDYIPKFLAAYIIGKNPTKYGFEVPTAEAHEPIIGVTVPSPIKLEKVAEVSQIPLESLKRFNTHLKTGVTPADTDKYKIWIPKQYEETFRDHALALNDHRMSSKEAAPLIAESSSNKDGGKLPKYYRVKRGDRLASIAEKYGLSVDQLREFNNLRSTVIYRGQRLKIKGADAEKESNVAVDKDSKKTSARSAKLASKTRDSFNETLYKVRRGDNLQIIAKKFGLTVSELKKLNRMNRNNNIQIGQILKVSRAS